MAENHHKKSLIKWAAAIAVIVIIIIAIVFLFRGSEEYTSDGEHITSISSLECSNSNTEDAFFVSDSAKDYTHEIKITFKDDKLANISYIYHGTYDSAESVEKAASSLHADYNIYMGDNGVDPEKLNPVFSNLENKLQVTLYGDKGKISSITAKLFFLDENEAKEISRYDAKKLETLYKNKGFSCTYRE